MKRTIGNVGVLDLRTTRDEAVESVALVKNVGAVIYSPETAHLVSKLDIQNMGASAEVPADAKIVTGEMEITRSYLEEMKNPLSLVVAGQVTVTPDVTPELAEEKIGSMVILGQIMAPEKVMGVVQGKIGSIQGRTLAYMDGSRLMRGMVAVDDNMLKSLEPGTNISVTGKLNITSEIDIEAFKEKIGTLEVLGKAVVKEEYADVFREKTGDRLRGKVEIIPEGYDYIPKNIELDEDSIRKYAGSRIRVNGDLEIASDVSGEAVKESFAAIQCKGKVICKKALKSVIMELCSGDAPKFLTYSGKLVKVDGEYTLTGPELEFTAEPLTLMVRGELSIDEEVSPEDIVKHVEHLDNYGSVIGGGRQLGALKTKLRSSGGEFTDRDKKDDHEEPWVAGVGNVGYLRL